MKILKIFAFLLALACMSVIFVECEKEENTAYTHTHTFGEADCTHPKTCSCGALEGKALGHDYEDATCTKPRTCRRCEKQSGDALGHSYIPGCTELHPCSRCGEMDKMI